MLILSQNLCSFGGRKFFLLTFDPLPLEVGHSLLVYPLFPFLSFLFFDCSTRRDRGCKAAKGKWNGDNLGRGGGGVGVSYRESARAERMEDWESEPWKEFKWGRVG